MPREREQPFGLHVLHHDFPLDVLVAGIGNVSARELSRDEGAIQRDAQLGADLAITRKRAPVSGTGRSERERFLGAIAGPLRWPAECFELVDRHRPALPGALRSVLDLGRHDVERLTDTDPRLLALLVEG